MLCNFKSFSTVYQSDQDNGRMMIRGCLQFLFVIGKTSSYSKVRPGTPGTLKPWARGYKTFIMLNSTEHEIFPLTNVKMPTQLAF